MESQATMQTASPTCSLQLGCFAILYSWCCAYVSRLWPSGHCARHGHPQGHVHLLLLCSWEHVASAAILTVNMDLYCFMLAGRSSSSHAWANANQLVSLSSISHSKAR